MMILLNNISGMECLSRPDSTHVRLVAFNNAAKNTQSSICSYLVLLFTKHTLSHYRPASYHLAMASYASCRANSFSFAIYHSRAYWPGCFSPGIVSSGKSAVTFFLAKEKIPGSSLYSLDEFFYWRGDRARKSPENKFLGYCC